MGLHYIQLLYLLKETDVKESLDSLIEHFKVNKILTVKSLMGRKLSNLGATFTLSGLK